MLLQPVLNLLWYKIQLVLEVKMILLKSQFSLLLIKSTSKTHKALIQSNTFNMKGPLADSIKL